MSKNVLGAFFKSKQAIATTIVATAILLLMLGIAIPVAINNFAGAGTLPPPYHTVGGDEGAGGEPCDNGVGGDEDGEGGNGDEIILLPIEPELPGTEPIPNATEVFAFHIAGNIWGGIYLDFEPDYTIFIPVAGEGRFYIPHRQEGERIYISHEGEGFVIILGSPETHE